MCASKALGGSGFSSVRRGRVRLLPSVYLVPR